MQAADGLNVKAGGLFQHSLHLHAVLAYDADEVAAGLGQPRLLHIKRTELAEGVRAEQNLVGVIVGHDDLGPVDPRGSDKMQGMAAQRQGVPFLDNDAAVGIVGAEVSLHHVEGLRRGNDRGLRVGLCKGGHRAGVVRLHVLHDKIVGCALA